MRHLVVVAAGVLALAGCTSTDDSSSTPEPSPEPPTSSSGTSAPTSGSPSPTKDPSTPVTPLDWKRVPGPVDDTVTRSSTWTVTVTKDRSEARIEGPESLGLGSGGRTAVSTVLVDQQRVVVVMEDERAERGDEATIIDSSGGTATLDGTSFPPTTTGGTWAMGQDTLVHATVINDGAYCLATVSLESGQGDAPWCAEPRHGFRGAVISDAGLSVMSFDDRRPVSCATLLAIDGSTATPFEGVTDCQGWDAMRLGDGEVWSEVPDPKRNEEAEIHGRLDGQVLDLGAATTGTLTYCAGSAYFVRDPQADDDPARLVRVDPHGATTVVYESGSRGNAFLSAPRCGGDAITITSYGDQGDEQVTADLG
jgi:hypothetical protein